MDYGSIYDLGGDEGNLPLEIKITPATGIWNQLKYFKQHPKEDIRMAYKFFVYAFWIGLISIIIGVLSLIITIFALSINS